jgi:hypothetical protein
MALDIYSGTFTRYYCRDWENVAQRMAKEQGYTYHQISPDGPVEDSQRPSPDEVTPAIHHWRDSLTNALGENISAPLAWDESQDAPYVTDRPGYPGYGGLMLWTAYADRPELKPPAEEPEGGWYEDPVFAAATEKESGTSFRQIIQPEIWLPCDFDFTFQGPSVVNQPTWIGSSVFLKRQLAFLNERTFKASNDEIRAWLQEEIEAASPVEHAAKFTFAVFSSICDFSLENSVPIIVSC